MKKLFSHLQNTGSSLTGRFRVFLRPAERKNQGSESGNVLFYIFLAVGLLAALSYAFTKDSRQSMTAQNAGRAADTLYIQANLIRSAISECALHYPAGGGDLDASGVVDTTDDPNTPYPVVPSSALNPFGVAADDKVKNVTCTGAPGAPVTTEATIFQGSNTQGRFLAPPPAGYSEWVYLNDVNGVYIQITAPNDASNIDALNRLLARYDTCQADLNYGACGARCFTVWIKRNACP